MITTASPAARNPRSFWRSETAMLLYLGAIDLYGPRYGLPPAISGINSFWQRGYGDPSPETLILVGFSEPWVDAQFLSCRIAAHSWNGYGVINEQTRDHPDIFVCGRPRQPWPDFWKSFRYYG